MKVKIFRGALDSFVICELPNHDGSPEIGHFIDELKEFITDYGEKILDFGDEKRLGFYDATFEWVSITNSDYEVSDSYLVITKLKYIKNAWRE